jgi:regulatory protein
MVITKIERQKKNPKRFSIYCDDEFVLGIHQDVLIKTGLRKGDAIDEEALKELQGAEELNLAREKALRFINYRMRSEKEIRIKLTEKEFHPDVIDNAIKYLEATGYVNDRAFAEAFLHDALLKKPSGAKLIRRQLRLKGIPADIIDDLLEKRFTAEGELALAREAATKLMRRYRVSAKKEDRLRRQKRLADYLARRGFAWDAISSVMKEFFPRND